jgi:sulfatase maturation enzyme AslB (radical SAM superfamily)
MNNFWNYEELSQLHIELTNNCNAACPMCPRFLYGSKLVRPDLELSQITLEDFIKWFPPEFIVQVNSILFCGTQGDPCIAKDFYEICEYIDRVSPKTAVRVNTNGGMRNAKWWYDLGLLFAKHRDEGNRYWQITFSIDGLEDTNHLYRRNVQWHKLMENVKAFIEGGGRKKLAVWDFLIFKHNEHQIEEAKQLAEELGFEFFVPKRALGVDYNGHLMGMPVLDNAGQLEYYIHAPSNPEHRNLKDPKGDVMESATTFTLSQYKEWKKNKVKVKDFKIENEDQLKILDSGKRGGISCKSQVMFPKGKEIFIDAFGMVSPCCYIGTHMNNITYNLKVSQIHSEVNKIGRDNLSLHSFSLKEILDNGFLNMIFADSWSKPSPSKGRIAFCEEFCGDNSKIDNIYDHEDAPPRVKNIVDYRKKIRNLKEVK